MERLEIMPRDEQNKLTPHAILGVFIALMGIIFTLDNLGLADTAIVSRYWPVIPIGIGVIMLMHATTTREWVFGSAWMAAGGLLLARSVGWLSFNLRDFLPLLLVVVGARLIWRDQQKCLPAATREPAIPDLDPFAAPVPLESPPPIPPPPPQFASPPNAPTPEATSGGPPRPRRGDDWAGSAFRGGEGRTPWQQWESWQSWRGRHWAPRRGHVRMLALMSGVERRLRGEGFASAEMTAIMGACELDLRQAEMVGNEAHISAFALWGGIEIRVPDHWIVVNRAMALMGGVEDTSRHVDSADRPRLYVHGFALMAGIEIKN